MALKEKEGLHYPNDTDADVDAKIRDRFPIAQERAIK